MKTSNSRNALVTELKNKILKARPNSIFSIKRKCVEEGIFTFDTITQIFSGEKSLEELEDAELYWLLAISGGVVNKISDVKDYFTEQEILSHKFFKTKEKGAVSLPYTFHNVEDLTPNNPEKRQFGFYISVSDLARFKADGVLRVIPEFQREGHKDRYGELITYVNKTRREEITKLIEDGRFFYNTIRMNLMDDEEAEWEYNKEKRELTIYKGTLIVPDGNHRSLAAEFVSKDNPHVNDKFQVAFTVLNPTDTKRLVFQELNVQKVNQKHKSSFDENTQNTIVDMIKRSTDLDTIIRDNIVTTGIQVVRKDGFIISAYLADAVKINYDLSDVKTRVAQTKVANWIVEYLNYLCYLMQDDFSDYSKLWNEKWSVSPFAIYGYIYLSSILMNRDNWEDTLKQILSSIDFCDKEIINFLKNNKKEKVKARKILTIFKEAAEVFI